MIQRTLRGNSAHAWQTSPLFSDVQEKNFRQCSGDKKATIRSHPHILLFDVPLGYTLQTTHTPYVGKKEHKHEEKKEGRD